MPHRALRLCAVPGCGAASAGRYCEKHSKLEWAEPGPRQPRLYERRRWRDRLRKVVLARDPLCMIQVLCGRGIGALRALSTEADHIVPRSRGGDDSMENLQGACHACHSHKTATEDSSFAKETR